MRTHARWLAAGVVTLAFGFWFLANAGSGVAADDKGPREAIHKIADALEKGDTAAAKSQAKAVADKNELEDVMHLFALRKVKGEGIGPKPGPNANQDGIEAKIMGLSKRVPPQELKTDAAALQRAAYITAAIAEIAQNKCPVEKKTGEKDPAQWKKWSAEMHTAALDLAKAVKAADAMAVKKAAGRLDGTCRSCHGVFRD
jgi:cytochrome c556